MQNNIFPTLFVGQNIEKLGEIDSTNNYLKLLLSNYEPPAHGTVIMAVNQFAGRGQRENKWLSVPGKNLTVSIFLETDFIFAADQFCLNKAISLAVSDCLTNFCAEHCKIKWPNDIYIADKKIGGILIENRVKGQFLRDSVIGIGLNINQEHFGDVSHATSLYRLLNHESDLDEILKFLCISVENRFLELKENKREKQDEEYLHNLFKYNEDAFFKFGDEVLEGKITGVDESGKLKISTNRGEQLFGIKEISFVL